MAYTVGFDAAALIKGLNLQLESAIGQAVQTVALTTQAAWQQVVLQTPGVWQPLRDRYAASIKVDYYPGGLGARIYSDDPVSDQFEIGFPARDLKRALSTSLKTRVAKSGKYAGQRFLIIPFRHNTPGYNALAAAMPEEIYQQASALTKSTVKRLTFRRNEIGAYGFRGARAGQLLSVRSRDYDWGGRLSSAKSIPKNYRGMVRFNTSSGGQKSSAYMTFRVMGEWSSGWIVPAKPGLHIVRGVAQQAQQMLASEVQQAIASAAGS